MKKRIRNNNYRCIYMMLPSRGFLTWLATDNLKRRVYAFVSLCDAHMFSYRKQKKEKNRAWARKIRVGKIGFSFVCSSIHQNTILLQWHQSNCTNREKEKTMSERLKSSSWLRAILGWWRMLRRDALENRFYAALAHSITTVFHLSDMISLNNAFDCQLALSLSLTRSLSRTRSFSLICSVSLSVGLSVPLVYFVQYASIKLIYALIGN